MDTSGEAHEQQDPVLTALVRGAEEDDEALPVMLLVPGSVIVGKLVSRDRWIKGLRYKDADANLGFRRLLQEPIAAMSPEEPGEPEGDDVVSGRYAHLVNVKITVGATRFGTPVLRVRVDSIAGWMPGEPG